MTHSRMQHKYKNKEFYFYFYFLRERENGNKEKLIVETRKWKTNWIILLFHFLIVLQCFWSVVLIQDVLWNDYTALQNHSNSRNRTYSVLWLLCPKKKKKKQKTKVVRCARCEQCSAEAQTTRSRAIEPGPSSPTPEKRQTPRAANGHRVPNPKYLLQLTLMRCIPTFIHRKVYIVRTYYCLLHTRFLFCN